MSRAFIVAFSTDIYHSGEHPYTLTYPCEASSPSHKDIPTGGEETIKISLTYKKATAPRQDKEWRIAVNKELDILK